MESFTIRRWWGLADPGQTVRAHRLGRWPSRGRQNRAGGAPQPDRAGERGPQQWWAGGDRSRPPSAGLAAVEISAVNAGSTVKPFALPILASRLLGLRLVAAVAITLAVAGCGGETGDRAERSPAPAQATAPAQQRTVATEPWAQEIWEVQAIDGVKVGYAHMAVDRRTEAGRDVFHFQEESSMALLREGKEVRIEAELSSVEPTGGGLESYQMRVRQGRLVMESSGRVVGGQLELELRAGGNVSRGRLPWPADCGGPHAVELSLWQSPMKPGQTRTLRALIPAINQIGRIELTARQYETVRLPEKPSRLLRIETQTTLADGQTLTGTLWTDPAGDILKEHNRELDLVSFRASKQMALEASAAARYDLLADLFVPVKRRLEEPYRSRRIRYRVRLSGDDPARVFPSSPTQTVRSTGPETAEVVVVAAGPKRLDQLPQATQPPGQAEREPNSIIQSDDATIRRLAAEAVGQLGDPCEQVLALEGFVHRFVEVDYSQAFASAVDVASTRRGDCSEHAVLLAALARAVGIPARVVVGLIYTEGSKGPGFAYHMWNQVYVEGRWVPLDATLALGGTGAARLAIAHHSLEGASALSCFLPVARVAGQLEIEILDAQ